MGAFPSQKNLDGEKLPPTIGTLIPHIQRANYTSMRDKSYRSPHPVLPDIINHGWTMNHEERLTPLMCLNKPAPIAVVDLIKCGCQTECKGQCSCHKNSLPCTPLCKCYGLGFCIHTPDYRQVKDDDSDAEWMGLCQLLNFVDIILVQLIRIHLMTLNVF